MSQFKKRTIVSIPTTEASYITASPVQIVYYHTKVKTPLKGFANQHLYLLSDETIQEGDFALNNSKDNVSAFKVTAEHFEYWENDTAQILKKIIATTDESLGLPNLPHQFLIEYADKGGIYKVEAEYETLLTSEDVGKKLFVINNYKLKISNGNVCIRQIKESWTKDQLPDLRNLSERMNRARKILRERGGDWNMLDTTELDKWIEENL